MSITFNDKKEASEYSKQLIREGWQSIVEKKGDKFIVTILRRMEKAKPISEIFELERPQTEAELLTSEQVVIEAPKEFEHEFANLLEQEFSGAPYTIMMKRHGKDKLGTRYWANTIEDAKCIIADDRAAEDAEEFAVRDNLSGEIVWRVKGSDVQEKQKEHNKAIEKRMREVGVPFNTYEEASKYYDEMKEQGKETIPMKLSDGTWVVYNRSEKFPKYEPYK